MFVRSGVILLLIIMASCTTVTFHELHTEGINYLKLHRFNWALESFLEAEELEPSNVKLLSDISYVYYKIGKYEASIKYTNKVLKIEPDNIKALQRKAVSYRKLGNYSKSINSLETLLSLNQTDYVTLYLLARNKFDLKQYQESITLLASVTSIISTIDKSGLPDREKKNIRKIERNIVTMKNKINRNIK